MRASMHRALARVVRCLGGLRISSTPNSAGLRSRAERAPFGWRASPYLREDCARGGSTWLIAGALLFALLAATSNARAQDTDSLRARREFEAGMALLEAGRFAEGAEHLRASLEADRRPATAYNLAVALRGAGAPVAATEVLDAMIRGEMGELSARGLASAETLRQELEQAVAELRLRFEGEGEATLYVNSVPEGEVRNGAERELRLDPGEHGLALGGEGVVPVRMRVTLEAGERRELALSLERPTADGRRRRRLAWGLGAAGVVLVATVVAVIVGTRGADLQSDPELGRFVVP